jgi:hypothetical protein
MTRDEFWQKIEKTETCWNWTGKVNGSGYGSATINGVKDGAHRHAYRDQLHGPSSPRLYILHHCDNPRCVRIDHLFHGTQSDNMIDCEHKGRNPSRNSFPKGNDHPYFGKTTSDANKKAMSDCKQKPFSVVAPDGTRIDGSNLTQFCKDNGLNQGAMWMIVSGKRCSHKGYTKASYPKTK